VRARFSGFSIAEYRQSGEPRNLLRRSWVHLLFRYFPRRKHSRHFLLLICQVVEVAIFGQCPLLLLHIATGMIYASMTSRAQRPCKEAANCGKALLAGPEQGRAAAGITTTIASCLLSRPKIHPRFALVRIIQPIRATHHPRSSNWQTSGFSLELLPNGKCKMDPMERG